MGRWTDVWMVAAASEGVSGHPCRIQKESSFKRKKTKSILGTGLTNETKGQAAAWDPRQAPGSPLIQKRPAHRTQGRPGSTSASQAEPGLLRERPAPTRLQQASVTVLSRLRGSMHVRCMSLRIHLGQDLRLCSVGGGGWCHDWSSPRGLGQQCLLWAALSGPQSNCKRLMGPSLGPPAPQEPALKAQASLQPPSNLPFLHAGVPTPASLQPISECGSGFCPLARPRQMIAGGRKHRGSSWTVLP